MKNVYEALATDEKPYFKKLRIVMIDMLIVKI